MTADYRILLVDDEPDVLEALSLAIRRSKEFRSVVDTASTGPSALEKLATGRFDLVLADHRMPGMTGIDLLSRVANDHPDVVRALITGHHDVDIALDALDRAKVHYYVQKPWNIEELRVTLVEALTGGWKQKL